MASTLHLFVFPHVEDRRFVEIQLVDCHQVVAANVILQIHFQSIGDGLRCFELRPPDEIYSKGKIL